MPKWYELILHGVTPLRNQDEISQRYSLVTSALGNLLQEIADVCRSENSVLDRAGALRSRSPGMDGTGDFLPSRYEGLNQLIHYAYCLIAAQRLATVGAGEIQIIPCGHEAGKGADVEAVTAAGERAAGEVFCVSPSLLPAKLSTSFKSLDSRLTAKVKFILFNAETRKTPYRPKKIGIGFFTFDRAQQAVSLLAFRNEQGPQLQFQPDLTGIISMNT